MALPGLGEAEPTAPAPVAAAAGPRPSRGRLRYAAQKFGLLLLTVFAALTLNFVLPRLMPGSPADAAIAKLARNGPVSPETREAVLAQLGAPTGSLWHQYVEYLGNIAHFDFGVSYSYFPESVSSVVWSALPWTLVLVGIVTIISFVAGTLLGVLAAWKRGTWLDTAPTVGGAFFAAFPYFWTALLLLYFVGYEAGWLPSSGAYGDTAAPELTWAFVTDAARHAVLPAVTIFLTSLGGWILGMRTTMINTLGEDYVLFAEANGLRPRTVALRYAARNAILPNLTAFGLAIGAVVGGSLLVERVFTYPGLGYLLYNAVVNQDYPLMQALFLMITVSVLVANFVVDLLYGILDPRTRR